MRQSLYQKYNLKEALMMVSLYPKKGELYSAGTSGVASYAKNIIKHMNRPVVVLADYDTKPEMYEEGNVLVIRCFKINGLSMWTQLMDEASNFPMIEQILVQFDFSVYGGMVTTAGILPFLAMMKLRGKSPSVISHHVVTDVFKLSGHVGLDDTPVGTVTGHIYNALFQTFYRVLGVVSDTVVVLEEPLKEKLSGYINHKKITAIPHGVDTDLETMSKAEARKKLGLSQDDYVVLFFGFVNWFKGADLFAKYFKNASYIVDKKTKAIIAGGISSTMKERDYYKKYFTGVIDTVCNSPVVDMTGYVPQEDIVTYFAAADLVVFPYRHFMTASGVMSLVFSYNKPFIVSENIGEMLDAPDFKYALNESGLKKRDITFALDKQSCLDKTSQVLGNGIKKKAVSMSRIMKQIRSYKNTALLFDEVLFAEKENLTKELVLRYTQKKLLASL
jgi:glycosyltransferase involved in cell wall biosynthesis